MHIQVLQTTFYISCVAWLIQWNETLTQVEARPLFHPVAKESLVSVERVVGIGTSWVAITRDCHLFRNKSLVAEKRTGLV
jgi:hypothetical protein